MLLLFWATEVWDLVTLLIDDGVSIESELKSRWETERVVGKTIDGSEVGDRRKKAVGAEIQILERDEKSRWLWDKVWKDYKEVVWWTGFLKRECYRWRVQFVEFDTLAKLAVKVSSFELWRLVELSNGLRVD